MRTPVIAISLLGAAVMSPTLAAPTANVHRKTDSHSIHHPRVPSGGDNTELLTSRSLFGLGLDSRDHIPPSGNTASWRVMPREFWKKVDPPTGLVKRLSDAQTMGGNAHSGNSGSTNGGSVYNPDETNNQGMPVIMNMNSNNAGLGGASTSGCAASGRGSKVGTGGNASSGNSGSAVGGNVEGSPGGMVNVNSNNAGTAGESTTGCATGGDTHDPEAEVVTATDPGNTVTPEVLREHNPFPNEQ